MKNKILEIFTNALLVLILVAVLGTVNANNKLSKNHYAFVKFQDELTTRLLYAKCETSARQACNQVLSTSRPDVSLGTYAVWQLLYTNPNKPNENTFWIRNVKLGVHLVSNSSRSTRLVAELNKTDKFHVWKIVKREKNLYSIINNASGLYLSSDFRGNVFSNVSSTTTDFADTPKWSLEFVFLSNLNDMMFESSRGVFERIGPLALTIVGVNLVSDYDNKVSLAFASAKAAQKWTIHSTSESGVFIIKNWATKLNLAWPTSARSSSVSSIDLLNTSTTVPDPTDPTQRWTISYRSSYTISALVNGVNKSLRVNMSPNSESRLYQLIYRLSNSSTENCDPTTLVCYDDLWNMNNDFANTEDLLASSTGPYRIVNLYSYVLGAEKDYSSYDYGYYNNFVQPFSLPSNDDKWIFTRTKDDIYTITNVGKGDYIGSLTSGRLYRSRSITYWVLMKKNEDFFICNYDTLACITNFAYLGQISYSDTKHALKIKLSDPQVYGTIQDFVYRLPTDFMLNEFYARTEVLDTQLVWNPSAADVTKTYSKTVSKESSFVYVFAESANVAGARVKVSSDYVFVTASNEFTVDLTSQTIARNINENVTLAQDVHVPAYSSVKVTAILKKISSVPVDFTAVGVFQMGGVSGSVTAAYLRQAGFNGWIMYTSDTQAFVALSGNVTVDFSIDQVLVQNIK